MLFVSFLWHMHQPWYLDPETHRLVLPWVRLHGTKDYLDMALILKEFPRIRAVFNVTPSFLEQVEGVAQGWQDEHQSLCRKAPEALDPAQVAQFLRIGFLGNTERLIRPYPRYDELFAQVGRRQPLTVEELRDLQVWSNLSWMDPRWRREIPLIRGLFAKGSHFTEEEKQALLDAQLSLLNRIIPTYRALQESGQLELTVSPWAHPILPLLYHTDTARQVSPEANLPSPPFHFPEDVRWHLKAAADQYIRWFGDRPQGLWPSEGALSQEILPALVDSGFSWTATDEELLWKSLKKSQSQDRLTRFALYQPYRIKSTQGDLTLLFRDRELSDLISFVYSRWEAPQAVEDFIGRLKAIDSGAPKGASPLVLLALDGENPWEFYPEDGEPFLKTFYGALSLERGIRCVTVSEYLKEHPAQTTLETLAPGSWIRGEFSTWIGNPSQNRAWEELLRARRLAGPKESRFLAMAEGSDWFWWFGPEHRSADDPIFDRLFRSYLKAAYRAAGVQPPHSLDEPFKGNPP